MVSHHPKSMFAKRTIRPHWFTSQAELVSATNSFDPPLDAGCGHGMGMHWRIAPGEKNPLELGISTQSTHGDKNSIQLARIWGFDQDNLGFKPHQQT